MLSALAPSRAAASAPPHFSTPLYHTFPRLGTIPAPNLLSGNNSLSSVHFRISRPMGRRGPPSGRLRRPAAAYEGLRPSALRVPPPPFPSGPKFSLPARPCGPAAACGRPAPHPAQKEKMFAPLDRCPKCWYNVLGKLRDMGELPWQQKQKRNTAMRVFPP